VTVTAYLHITILEEEETLQTGGTKATGSSLKDQKLHHIGLATDSFADGEETKHPM